MKWFGYPVETVEAVVDGKTVEVATVYQWADGTRRACWDVAFGLCERGSIRREPLAQSA